MPVCAQGDASDPCDWNGIDVLDDDQIERKLEACSQASGETLPNDTSDMPDYSSACFPKAGTLNPDQIDACFNSWGIQEEANEEQAGFYSEDEINENANSILGLSPDSDIASSGGLNRRAQCKLEWNIFAVLKNCVILPVLRAILPSAIYNAIEGILSVFGESKFKFTLSQGFTSAEVELVDGSLDLAAGIGILFDLTFKGKIVDNQLFELPLSPLTIPGIIVVGPFLSMHVGLGYELGAKGKVIARNNIGWSNMTAKLDMLDGNKSHTGRWTRRDPVPLVSVELEGYAKLDPYVTAGLYFGVSILSGKLKVSAGIEAKASLPVTTSVAVRGGTNTATTFQGCQGVTVSLEAKLEVYLTLDAGKFNRHYYPEDIAFPIFSQCIGIPIAVRMDKLAKDVPVPVLEPTVPNATYRTINAQLKNAMLHVVWLPKPNNNLVAIPPTEVVDGPGSIHRLFLSLTTSERNATAGVYDNRVLHINSLLMHLTSASPLILSPKEAVPKDALVVVLRSELGPDGRPAFVGAVIGNREGKITPKSYYYPVVCIYDPKYRTPARVFLVKDPVRGPKYLMGFARKMHIPVVKLVVDGPPFEYCQFAAFTIS
ncbi:Apple protein [Mycena venus]|uniref:Apple protein n=1 Tax=Mycena venus TaxID=2733690 RepID=A0A8H7D554_9AGAR|nr:Apple protein [Mycena venus]